MPQIAENQPTESHRWVSECDHNGNRWSDEQLDILNHIAIEIENHRPIRVAIDAVAGSGKTTVLRGILVILSNAQNESLDYALSMTPIAFNKSIAQVLATTMNAVKPDGADWVSKGTGTLNGHGRRTVAQAFSHDFNLGDAKWTMLSRCATVEFLADDAVFEEWETLCKTTEKGNKRYQSQFNATGRLLRDVAQKAMGFGLFLGGESHTEEWAHFMQQNAASFGIADLPIGERGFAALYDSVRWMIDTSMAMLADPLMSLAPRFGMVWTKIDRPPYSAMIPVFDAPAKVIADIGCIHNPEVRQGNKDLGSIERYSTTGRFGHARVVINFPRLDGDAFRTINNALKTTSWSEKMAYKNQGDNVNPQWDVRPPGASGWVRSIKDTPTTIRQFCAAVEDAIGIDMSPLFSAIDDESPTEDIANALLSHADCIYAPVHLGLKPWRTFDLILADEVQDMSVLQGTFMRSLMREGGSAVIVGDPKQSLYLFSGSSSESMAENISALDCEVFPMTYCYRLTAQASFEVRHLLGTDSDGNATKYAVHRHPDYIGAWKPGSPSRVIHEDSLADEVRAGDMVLCRVGAPLVPHAMACLRNGIPARIAGGGDLEKGVRRLAQSIGIVGAETLSMTDVRIAASDYLEGDKGVLQKCMKRKEHKGDEASARKDEDFIKASHYCEAIVALVSRYLDSDFTGLFCATDEADNANTADWLADLFCDPNGDGESFVMFSSVHRAKGLERSRVFIIADRMVEAQSDFGESKIQGLFMLPWSMNNAAEIDQELNAVYVAITRCLTENIYVSCRPAGCTVDTVMSYLPTMIGGVVDDESPAGDDEDDDESESTDVESESIESDSQPENTPAPTDGAEDDSEATQVATTHQNQVFGCFLRHERIGVECAYFTDCPVNAQSWLERNTPDFTTPYDGGTWLPCHEYGAMGGYDTAVFAMWLECPADVREAFESYREQYPLGYSESAGASINLFDDDTDDDDTDGDGDAVSTDDDPTDGDAPSASIESVEDESTVDDESQGRSATEPIAEVESTDDEPHGCITYRKSPDVGHWTVVGQMTEAWSLTSRASAENRATSLITMLEHCVDCVVCREELESHGNRFQTITDASIASIQNTTVGTIRRVLEHISPREDWENLTLARDEAGDETAYACCLRTISGRIQRNTDVEIWFTTPKHRISEPITSDSPGTEVETIEEILTDIDTLIEAMEESPVDDSPPTVEVEWVRKDRVCICGKSLTHHDNGELLQCLSTLIEEGYSNGEGADLVALDEDGYETEVDDSPQTAEPTPEPVNTLRRAKETLTDIHGNQHQFFALSDAEIEAFAIQNRNAPYPAFYCFDGVAVLHGFCERFAYYTGLSYCDMKPRLMVDANGAEYTVWLDTDAESEDDTTRISDLVGDITYTEQEDA